VESLQGLNVFLVGMMGCGKTTVGKVLAEQLKYRFFDSDLLIERVTQRSIAEIFAQEGETEFRNLETKVLSELAAQTRSVIATGGGIVLRRQNWGFLHHGVVVWLAAPVPLLVQRLQGDASRPLLQVGDLNYRLQELLSQRQALYQQADLTICLEAEQSPTAIAAQILTDLPQCLKPLLKPELN